MRMKVIFAVLFALVGVAIAQNTPWEKCDGVSGSITVTKVDLTGCTGNPCQLKKGSNATVTISYTLTGNLSAVYNQVYGVIGGIPIKFPGFPADQSNACTLGMKCPGMSGNQCTETVTLPVASGDPAIKVVARWKLTEDEGGDKVQGCFEVPLQIIS